MLNSSVTIQFTIGFLDDDSNCVGDASTYPPVYLQYREHKNDHWITEWNTSDVTSNSMINICLISSYKYVKLL